MGTFELDLKLLQSGFYIIRFGNRSGVFEKGNHNRSK